MDKVANIPYIAVSPYKDYTLIINHTATYQSKRIGNNNNISDFLSTYVHDYGRGLRQKKICVLYVTTLFVLYN